MRNYNENVNDYLSEELLGEVECNIGDDLPYIPFEETEANFCFLESINPVDDKWELVFRIENEFSGEKYRKNYTVSKGTRLELNTFDVPFMCFLPPDKIPVLVEVIDVSVDSISLNTVGVLQEYADEIDRQPADFEKAN